MRVPALTILLPLCLLVACDRDDDQRTGSVSIEDIREARDDLPPAARAQLDSGNLAYRAGELDAARRHYRAVIAIDDEHAAPWFGLFMVERAAGDTAAATQALRRARDLAPGASLIHPEQDEEP